MLRPLVLAGLMLLVEGVKAKSGKDSRLPGEGTWRLRYRTLWAEGSGCSEEYMDVQVLCPIVAVLMIPCTEQSSSLVTRRSVSASGTSGLGVSLPSRSPAHFCSDMRTRSVRLLNKKKAALLCYVFVSFLLLCAVGRLRQQPSAEIQA